MNATRQAVNICLVLASISISFPTEARRFSAACGNGNIIANGSDVFWVSSSNNEKLRVYFPPNDPPQHEVSGLASCRGGVVTAFRDLRHDYDWVYFSPDCLNVGGGGNTINVYSGKNHQVIDMTDHPTKPGMLTTFQNKGGGRKVTYYSPDCTHVGGGGNTTAQ
jgi:hypothetical protein